jgi:hypothetical protein
LTVAGLAILVLGLVSYKHGVPGNTLWINSQDDQSRVRLAVIAGIVHAVYSTPLPGGSTAGSRNFLNSRTKIDKQFGPFYARRVPVSNVVASGVGGPFWALLPLLWIWPAMAFVHGPLRRWRRRRAGRCTRCGYPLTGLPEPRCPECGRATAQ